MFNLNQLKKGFIVSCQAFEDEEFYGASNMVKMAKCALKGGADAIRACWASNIRAIKKEVDIPIIGINKVSLDSTLYYDKIMITPTIEFAIEILDAGADIIAFDGTFRGRTKRSLEDYISELKKLNVALMADISTVEEGLFCAGLGVDIISTTLSGYTKYSNPNNKEPDFKLIEELKKRLDKNILINAEGRFWEVGQVNKAYFIGADMVTVGGAITRPELITKHFIENIERGI